MKVQELKDKISRGEKIRLIDVREVDEYTAGDKIEGAENIPMGKVFTEVSQGHFSKDVPTVTFCRTGGRCEIVARELQAKGYNIDYLEGGLEEWKKS